MSTADVTITRPNRQSVAVSSIQEVGLNRFRISFTSQTLVGTYHIKIGPDVSDLAGNRLDQDQDGVFGEQGQDVYDATFNLVAVDLGLHSLDVAPSQLWAGEMVTVSWRGINRTGAPLLGDWTDGVYLSSDDHWDINDDLLATVPHTGGLAANQEYAQAVTVPVPGKLPGNYRILVRADVTNQERETNEADNVIASAPIALSVRPLPVDGTPIGSTLTRTDPSDYYAVQLAAGDSLRLVLDGQAATGANELDVGFGSIPTRLSYVYKKAAGGQDQELVLTGAPGGGTYYILVYGDQIDSSTPYSLMANAGPVFVTDVSPHLHGNGARGTVTLSGAGFDVTTSIEFIGPDGVVRIPTATRIVSPETLALDLDLPSWVVGAYVVRVTEGSVSSIMPGAFHVVQGGVARLETDLIVPANVGPAFPTFATLWVVYRNTGDVPTPAPLLAIRADGGALITDDLALAKAVRSMSTPPEGVGSYVGLMGVGSGATPWILQPGDSARVSVYYLGLRRDTGADEVGFSLVTLTADDERTINWRSQESLIRPAGLSDEDWARRLHTIRHIVGPRWGDYRLLGK